MQDGCVPGLKGRLHNIPGISRLELGIWSHFPVYILSSSTFLLQKPYIMLRTPSIIVDSQYDTSSPLVRSIEDHDQIRWGSISSTQPVLSGPEQIRVYHEWIGVPLYQI